MQVLEKDSYEFQRARIEHIVEGMAPGKSVEFDRASTFIKFRVRDMGINLTEPSGEWLPSELAVKSDDWLRDFIKHLSNGKI